ncbi:SDR family oxidoreductase [Streptomyces zaehneri]|uniref:SDR family oxidoreductase n=1 Tax=Streptomyces zaehneri TaxID=3051180 RepID=UPI0028D4BB7F|nr:NAD(P)H-binding protein [Streptomyces sp. DSM 40713]
MIVVTGATGNVGRELVRVLAAAGERVTATSRNITDGEVPDGVRAVRADLTDKGSLWPVLDGANALFLHDGGPGGHPLKPQEVLDAARKSGIARVVLLSSLGVVTRPDSVSHGGTMRAVEDAVRESGLTWTLLRPGAFHSNAYAWAEPVRVHRTAAAPFADVALPTVDPADIAAVAAVALREDGHTGRAYELTGPVATTPRERAAAIGAAIGEPVRFVEQIRREAREQMLAFLPEPVVETTLAVLGEPTPAERRVSPDAERLLGRAPRTFEDWARRNAAAFR